MELIDESGKVLFVKEFVKVGNLFGIYRKGYNLNVKNNFLFVILKYGYIKENKCFFFMKYINKLRRRYV